MQGQRSTIGSLPESLGFDHGSSSSETGIDHQICWNNNMRNPAQNRLSGYVSPSDTSDIYLNPTSQEGQNLSVWSTGEPSSSASQIQVGHGDQKTENDGWSSLMKNGAGAGPSLETQRYEPASTLSLDDVNINVNRNQIANGHGPLFLQSSSISDSITHDVNMNSSFGCHDVMDSGVIECRNAFGSRSSESLQGATASSSSGPFGLPSGVTGAYLEGQTDGRPGRSLDGRRLPCKRKALELSMGQSSESESSNFFQHPEGGVWHAVPARRNVNNSLTISGSSGDILGSRSSEQIIPRLGLGVGGNGADNRHASSAAGSAETTHRNIRLRINASRQESLPISSFMPISNSVGQSSSYPPAIVLPTNNPVELRSPVVVENSSSQGQPVLRVPALRRNLQVSRWSRNSSSRPSRAAHVVSGERDVASLEESRTALRNISEHPIFMPATEIRAPAQNAVNWSLTGGTVSNAGNVASSSRSSSISGVHPLVAHRNYPHYPRRLSELVRRSLMSADSDAGEQVNNNVFPPPSGTSASSQEAAPPSLPGGQGHHLSHSRSAMMLDRQLDGAAFALPYLSRSLATASEGRNRLVSEIRNVLDLMRRGDGLRFEDVMILDQSVFYGMPDIHDRHRDMRLDIDNMSYEELLALEERIGNVNTGLNEETILKRLKQQKFATKAGQVETEPCCICQEEYNDGDDLGGLECGHDFHTACIKQWLLQKNLCPICKSTAFAT